MEIKYNLGELTNAIVIQACNDLFTCKRMIEKRNKNTANRINNCRKLADECIEFFESEYYDQLINGHEDLKGHKILAKIQEMVDDEDRYPNDYNPFKQTQYIED